MKKIITLLLVALMLFTVVSCESGVNGETTTTPTTLAQTTAASTTQAPDAPDTPEPTDPTDPPAEGASFYAGYARVDITPDFSAPVGDNMSVGVSDKIYATVIAISDGENKALLITADLRHSKGYVLEKTFRVAEQNGVPRENVILNATHNHSAVSYDDSNTYAIVRWRNLYYAAIEEGIASAIADLKPATAEIGEARTPGYAFVRRYYMEDGSFKSIHHSNPSTAYKEHETEADDQMQVIRFNRGEAKDIVMVNWQAHPAQAVDKFPAIITSDFVHFFREGAEEKFDINFAYYQGACGNINNITNIASERKFQNYIELGRALPDVLGEALENMTPVELGKIQADRIDYEAIVNHSEDHLYETALKVVKETNEAKKKALAKELGFHSKYEASSIVTRHNYGKSQLFSLTAISFGDLAFATTPYEMFDTNGMEVKEGSPFKMTFMCSCTNGSWSYIAADHAYENGGYEVYNCKFVRGTGEAVVAKLLGLLDNQFKNK